MISTPSPDNPQSARALVPRLCIMYFLHSIALGAVVPIFSLYLLQEVGLSGTRTGIVLSMAAVSAFVSPLVWAIIVDRLISAERLLALSHAVGAVLVWSLSQAEGFYPILFGYLGYMIFMGATMPLTNTVVFGHLQERGRGEFGRIRVYGTVGWIAVAWFFSFFWLRVVDTAAFVDALRLSAVASVIMSLWSLSIPQRRLVHPGSISRLIPKEAIRVVLRPKVLSVAVAMLLVVIMDRFYIYGGSPLLSSLGAPSSSIMPIMSLGQMPELFALFFLDRLVRRWGYRRVLLFGLIFQLFRFTVFMLAGGLPLALVVVGFSVHGFTYAFGIALCSMYVDTHCEPHNRGGVHQILQLMSFGVGNVIGNVSAGLLAEAGGPIGITGFELLYAAMVVTAVIAVIWVRVRLPAGE
ncbi:MAG: MFS transporter [Spirochaeta sp.]